MQNIGAEFKLRLHTQRWGHRDNYTLTKTENGWIVNSLKVRGEKADQHGSPAFIKALEGESISYPSDLGYHLSDIWDASQTKSKEEVQGYFDELAAWLNRIEESKPNFSSLHI